MKIEYTTKNERLRVEIETDSAKDAFKKLAEFQEVFAESTCGICKNDDLQFVVRTVDSNDYFELKCKACTGKLAFGQHKSGGTLFPKRKVGESYENRGWHMWKAQA